MAMTSINLRSPYLVFLGDVDNVVNAKTGLGIAHWAADRCAGQLRFSSCRVDCGLPDLDVTAAIASGVRTVVIGVAPVGGRLQDSWMPPLIELARAGIDVASGLHSRLTDLPTLVEAARAGGAKLIDVRTPPPGLPCGLGRKRSGKRLLTVGTDCAVGKKYTALALQRELAARGIDATFRATGQTGIMIAGEGIPIDAVVADFVSGAAEVLSPDNEADHWDIIEGQGSLLHPSYAGVTLGLVHGSQPDAIVLCHAAGREAIHEVHGHVPIPPLDVVIGRYIAAAQLTNEDCVVAGISVNTAALPEKQKQAYLDELNAEYKVPVVDPLLTGVGAIVDELAEVTPPTVDRTDVET